MTSSIVPYVYDFVVRCDKKVCSSEARKSIRAATYKERKQAEARACDDLASEGWTFWVGTHPASRDYCPEHKPDPRSTMRQVKRNANVY